MKAKELRELTTEELLKKEEELTIILGEQP